MQPLHQAKAYSYIRFSTPEQAKGDSLRRQMMATQEYAEKHGLTLDTTLSMQDCGVSAFKGKNRTTGGLAAFISAVEMGRVARGSYLLIESLDRLSREHINKALRLFLALLEKGIVIVTLIDGQKYTEESVAENPTSLMMSLVVMWRAYEESATKSERVAKAAESRRQNLGNKKFSRVCPGWLRYEPTTDKFEVIEERAAIVRWIFAQAEKGIGKYRIVKMLEENGTDTWGSGVFKSRKGRKWHASYVDKILNSEAATGRFTPHKMADGRRIPAGEAIPDYFPRLIPDALFERVRRHAATNKQRPGRIGAQIGNLFTHIAFCARTGVPAVFFNKGKWSYIKADGKLPNGTRMKGWPMCEFESFFLSAVGGLDLSRILRANDNNLLEVETRLGEAQHELRDVKRRLLALMAALEEGGELKSVVSRIRELETRESELQVFVKEMEGRGAEERAVLASAELTAENLRQLMNEKSPEKRLLLRQEIRRVTKRIDIEFEIEPTADEAMEQSKLREKLKFLRRKGAVLAEIPGKGRAATITFVNGVKRRIVEAQPGVAAFATETGDESVTSGTLIFQPGLVPPPAVGSTEVPDDPRYSRDI